MSSESSLGVKQDIAALNRETFLQDRTRAQEKVAHFGRQYNSLLPVSKLPLEILLKIFLYHTEHPDRSQLTVSPFALGPDEQSFCARTVSQVCHHWRKAALGAPILWRQFIDCKRLPPKWFQVVLRRARSSPLQVTVTPLKSLHDFNKGPNFVDANVHLALREIGNIGELNISCSTDEGIIRPLLKHLQQPAPSLRRLHLDVTSGRPDIEVQLLPVNIFSGITGPLQHLSLSNCFIYLQSPLYHHLTYLCIKRVPPSIAPSISQWLNMLRTAPWVTSLILEWVFSPSEISDSVPDVHLPQLSKLEIVGPTTLCSQFLCHIRYPVLQSFNALLLDVDLENTPSLSSFIKLQLSNVEPFRLCSVRLADDLITLTNGASLTATDTEKPFFAIEFSEGLDVPFNGPRLLSSLLTSMAVRTSHCEKLLLTVTPEQEDSLEEFFKILGRTFSSITSLEIRDGSELILDHLCFLDNDGTSPANVQLPNLQDLSVNADYIPDSLLTFLHFRKNHGLGIKNIRFPGSLQDFSQLEAVKTSCSSVILDGLWFASANPTRLVDSTTSHPRKEYFAYHEEEPIDPEIEAVAG